MNPCSRSVLAVLASVALLGGPLAAGAAEGLPTLPTPEDHFGFEPGADRELFDYGQLIGYLEKLAEASPRLELREVGSSPMGKPMYVAFVSAEQNLQRLQALREINRRLALEPDIVDAEREQMVREGRVFVMATLSMHSGEVGPAQSLPLFAYQMATTDEPALLEQLSQVVLMIVPNHNPDGMDMIVNHYRTHKGTKYEGSSMPGVYHKYVGHDNNRDFVTLTQEDTKVISRLYSTEWYPQVLVEKHQMGSTGPRYFVPSNHDPIAENIDEGLYNWMAVFGANLAKDMGDDGLRGVASHWLFDNYWPGSTETSHWKNVISFLTEAASCKAATPVFVEPTELQVRGKGLSEYKKSVNMPDPWPGGWWRLGDIVRYELSSMRSILATAARHRQGILEFRNDLCRKEIEKGLSSPPHYYVMPEDQHDRGALTDVVRLLERHGVSAYRLSGAVTVAGRAFAAGDVVVPLNQPYRAFIKEVLETQEYPVRHYTPGGKAIEPYDITSWSLPLHGGVESHEITVRSEQLESLLQELPEGWGQPGVLPEQVWALGYSVTDNASFEAAFLALGKRLEVSRLEESAEIEGALLPVGSFLIRGARRGLEEVFAAVNSAPVVLTETVNKRTTPMPRRRVALIETWFHDMDAGWTRYVLDSFHIPYRVVRPGEIEELDLAKEFDVVVFPGASKDVLLEGKYKFADRYWPVDYPPEFAKPVGDEGMEQIVRFLEGGGIVVSWRGSTGLFLDGLKTTNADGSKDAFDLPVRDVAEQLAKKGLHAPGSFLRIELLADHPLTYGMPSESGVFSRGAPVFETSIPMLDMDRRVIAKYPEKDILLSGYAVGEEQLANKPVMVWVRKGKGQIVLFGFNPQFRASTPASYKLLFNALLLPQATRPCARE